MSSACRTTLSKSGNRNRRAVANQPTLSKPWLLIASCMMSAVGSLATYLWILSYQATVADYVREPSKESRANAHSYFGYPTPSFRQPLIAAADAAYERNQALVAEIARLQDGAGTGQAETARAIATLVNLVMPAIEHDIDAKRSLLSEAFALAADCPERRAWGTELAAMETPASLPIGTHLESISFNPSTSTAKARCLASDGTFVGKLTTADFQVIDQQGLPWPHFKVTEDNRSFSNASTIVLIDRSLSMEGERMKQLKAGLLRVLEAVTVQTRMRLVAFDHSVDGLTPFTSESSLLQNALNTIQPRGATAIADAAIYAIKELDSQPGVRCILLCTDGQDDKLRAGLKSIVGRCQESNIQVNILAINHAQLDKATLEELANSTGGCLAYAEQPGEIVAQLDFIVNSCKPSYRVRIFPANRPLDSFSIRLRSAPDQLFRIY